MSCYLHYVLKGPRPELCCCRKTRICWKAALVSQCDISVSSVLKTFRSKAEIPSVQSEISVFCKKVNNVGTVLQKFPSLERKLFVSSYIRILKRNIANICSCYKRIHLCLGTFCLCQYSKIIILAYYVVFASNNSICAAIKERKSSPLGINKKKHYNVQLLYCTKKRTAILEEKQCERRGRFQTQYTYCVWNRPLFSHCSSSSIIVRFLGHGKCMSVFWALVSVYGSPVTVWGSSQNIKFFVSNSVDGISTVSIFSYSYVFVWRRCMEWLCLSKNLSGLDALTLSHSTPECSLVVSFVAVRYAKFSRRSRSDVLWIPRK